MIDSFMPHGYCMMWKPELVWLHGLGDIGMGLAYFAISVALVSLVMRKNRLPFPHLFLLFAVFILACGATHLLSLITIWEPWYWAEGMLKAVTAVISVGTAGVLLPKFPQLLILPTPAELGDAKDQLPREIQRGNNLQVELASKEKQLTHLADRLLTAQEDERRRIARDLHDESGQSLSLVQMELAMLLQTGGIDAAASDKLEELSEKLEKLHQSLRGLSHRLHPAIIDIAGLHGAILGLTESIEGCEVRIHPDIDSLKPSMSLDVYRIIQECLGNIIKHAHAEHVQVLVDVKPSMVLVSVSDDGVGFKPQDNDGGIGLMGIQERVLSRRGSFVVDSDVGRGTRVEVKLPRVERNAEAKAVPDPQ